MIFDEQKNKSAVQNFQGNNIVSESFFNIDGKEVLQKDYTNGYKITISINQSQKSFESEEELIGWWLENILTDDDMLVVNRDAKLYKIVTENKKLASKILEIN